MRRASCKAIWHTVFKTRFGENPSAVASRIALYCAHHTHGRSSKSKKPIKKCAGVVLPISGALSGGRVQPVCAVGDAPPWQLRRVELRWIWLLGHGHSQLWYGGGAVGGGADFGYEKHGEPCFFVKSIFRVYWVSVHFTIFPCFSVASYIWPLASQIKSPA